MTPEELLGEVSKAVREREASGLAHPGWERLARGEISEDEARRELVRSAEDEKLLAVFLPLGQEFTDGVAARILQGQSEAAACGPVGRLWQRIRATWSRSRWQSRVALGALAATAAAVLAAVVFVSTADEPLPAYEASFVGGDRTWRSAVKPASRDALPELSLGSQLEWRLLPVRAVRGEVDVRMFVVRGRSARPWAPPFEVSPQGVVRIRGTAAGLGLTPGPWTLVVALGRPGAVPDEPQRILELIDDKAEKDPSVHWFRQSVVIVDGE